MKKSKPKSLPFKDSQYEGVLQRIHSAETDFAKKKWQDVLKFLQDRERAKKAGLPFPPKS